MHDVIESFITSNSDIKQILFDIEIPNYGPLEFYYHSTAWVNFY